MTEQEIRAKLAQNPKTKLGDIALMITPETTLDDDFASFLVNNKLAATVPQARKFLARAKRDAPIREALGCVPKTPREYVTAFLTAADYKLDPPMTWISPRDRRRTSIDRREVFEQVLDKNRNLLGGQFHKSDLADEISFFFNAERTKLRHRIFENLCDSDRAATAEQWGEIADRILAGDDRELSIAAIKKFIWQVKRKMSGMKVTDHLMIFFYGAQRSGKSEFVKLLCRDLDLFFTYADFDQLSDNREVDLFTNYIVFLDEMEKAGRADMESVKSVITRDDFSYRPMGTNQRMAARQLATFIGTSNKTLGELIKDTTGNRRFAQIDFARGGPAEWDFINSLDFTALWCSVDHLADDPMRGLEGRLQDHQREHLVESPLTQFLGYVWDNACHLRIENGETTHRHFTGSWISKEELFLAYRQHCDALRVRYSVELDAFIKELNRLNDGDGFPFEKGKSSGLMKWRLLPNLRRLRAA